ncbi:MAG: hypothetical protein ACR2KK_16955 [Acidimicrobiales bacterium]
MTTRTKKETESQSERRRTRAELWDSLPAVAMVLTAFGIMILVDPDGLSPLNLVWAGLQIGAVVWLVWVNWRSLRRADEYQRLVKLEALAIGFATVMVLSFGAGILEGLGVGDPRQSLQVASGAGFLTWNAAYVVMTRRAQ